MFIADVLELRFHYNGKPIKVYATSEASSLDYEDDIRPRGTSSYKQYRQMGLIIKSLR